MKKLILIISIFLNFNTNCFQTLIDYGKSILGIDTRNHIDTRNQILYNSYTMLREASVIRDKLKENINENYKKLANQQLPETEILEKVLKLSILPLANDINNLLNDKRYEETRQKFLEITNEGKEWKEFAKKGVSLNEVMRKEFVKNGFRFAGTTIHQDKMRCDTCNAEAFNIYYIMPNYYHKLGCKFAPTSETDKQLKQPWQKIYYYIYNDLFNTRQNYIKAVLKPILPDVLSDIVSEYDIDEDLDDAIYLFKRFHEELPWIKACYLFWEFFTGNHGRSLPY